MTARLKYSGCLVAALFLGIAIASYFEQLQVRWLLPLRNFIVVPDREESYGHRSVASSHGLPLKASHDGNYLNPHQIISSVYDMALEVLAQGCEKTASQRSLQLMRVAKALMEIGEGTQYGGYVWRYPIHQSVYGIKPGWISGMVQSSAAVVLSAAAVCSTSVDSENRYSEVAARALLPFHRSVAQGGVSVLVLKGRGLWFEEYADPSIKPPMVLNGHIYALLALRDMLKFSPTAELATLVSKGTLAVREKIHEFDIGVWSMYDLHGTPANNIYQQALHVRQMGELAEWLHDPKFTQYQRRFFLQRLSPISAAVRLWIRPSSFLALIVTLDVLIALGMLLTIVRPWRPR